MPDPIARLEFYRQEVDRVFGAGHAVANPELVSTIMLTAALDFAAIRLSRQPARGWRQDIGSPAVFL
jgi:hypothetical protein